MKSSLVYVVAFGTGAAPISWAVERPASLDEKPHTLKAIPVQDIEEVPVEKEEKKIAIVEANPAPEPVQPVQLERPFLGIGSQAIDETLATHLGLEYGVVVKTVHPGSGAAQAGLTEHDILLKLDEKKIDSPFALRDAIQNCEVGEEITVGLIRKGQREERAVVLGARPQGIPGIDAIPPLQRGLGQLQQIWPNRPGADLPDEAKEHFDRLKDMIDQQLNGVDIGLKFHEFFDEDFPAPGGQLDVDLNAESSVTWADDDGNITMKMRNGNTEVIVRDRENNIIFEGPWDTPQDKAAVEPEIRERIENLGIQREGNQLKFWMQGLPGAGGDE